MIIKIKNEGEPEHEMELPSNLVEQFVSVFGESKEITSSDFIKFISTGSIIKKFGIYRLPPSVKTSILDYLAELPAGLPMCDNPVDIIGLLSDDVTIEDIKEITILKFYQSMSVEDNNELTYDGYILLNHFLNGRPIKEVSHLIKLISDNISMSIAINNT